MECQNNVRINLTDDAHTEKEVDGKTEVPTISGSVEKREKSCESNSNNALPLPEAKK